jgi:ABC-type multidrug transport system fused ATPase/permease subunit
VILFTRSGDVKFVIGIFAVTALRLLPVLKAILVGWTQIQNSIYCLDTIEEGLKGYENETPYKKVDIKFASNLSVENLYYAYPNGGYIFSGLNFVVNKGEYVGICGASGIGKTTLFNLIVGLIKQDAGEIKVDGIPISKDMYASWIQMISYVPQDVFIFNGSLAENIALGSNNIDTEKINDIIHKAGLDELVASLHFGIDASLGECGVKLSGGEKQRIGIARALYKNAQLLLLDEATSALDNDMEKEINLIIKRLRSDNRGLTILSIAHRESSLSYCDRIINLKKDGVEQNI